MIDSVTRRAEFAALRSHGLRVRYAGLRMSYVSSVDGAIQPPSDHQIAFAINRKFGTAVERNRARRRLKAAFAGSIKHGGEACPLPGLYLLIPSRRILECSSAEVNASLEGCLARVRAAR